MFSHPVSVMVSANSAQAATPEFLFLSGIAPSSGTMAIPLTTSLTDRDVSGTLLSARALRPDELMFRQWRHSSREWRRTESYPHAPPAAHRQCARQAWLRA